MAQVDFDPFIKWFRGRIRKLVYRRVHNGKVSVFPLPDTSHIQWSRDQIENEQLLLVFQSKKAAGDQTKAPPLE